MNLENQVCSLESSKRLKELGVKQKSLFYWIKAQTSENVCAYGLTYITNIFDEKENFKEIYSAFTVAELGEMLPDSINEDFIKSQKKDDEYKIYIDKIDKIIIFFSKNEADARAKMLIYLLENGLMELSNE